MKTQRAPMLAPKIGDSLLAVIEGAIIEATGDGEYAAYVARFLRDTCPRPSGAPSSISPEQDHAMRKAAVAYGKRIQGLKKTKP